MDKGWCPFARQHRGAGQEGPFGYPAGTRGQNVPVMFVDHTMGGFKRTLDNDVWRHQNGVGVTFGIGQDGSTDQYCSIFDAHWGNGIAGRVSLYDRSNPRLGFLEQEGHWNSRPAYSPEAHSLDEGAYNLLNARSISTEHEDLAIPDPVWSQAMFDADVRVKKWCLEELTKYGMPMPVSPSMLVGHNQIDGVNRAHCPGTNYPRAQLFAAVGGRMYTDAEIDQKIGQLLAAVASLQKQIDNPNPAPGESAGLKQDIQNTFQLALRNQERIDVLEKA